MWIASGSSVVMYLLNHLKLRICHQCQGFEAPHLINITAFMNSFCVFLYMYIKYYVICNIM